MKTTAELHITSTKLVIRSMSSNAPKSQVIGWWWTKKNILNVVDGTESHTQDDNKTIINKVRGEMLNLKGSFFSADGLSVDYAGMGKSEALLKYEHTVAQLRCVDLSGTTEIERRSFFINTYNSLLIHALARSKASTDGTMSTLDRMKLYAKFSYEIGGHAYCLDDIEHGILRGNKCSPAPLTSPPFSAQDPRLPFIVTCDPRIHFTLNCGAKSCPPIGVYSDDSEAFERQLVLATELFLDSTVTIDVAKQSVHMSKILDWYRVDFGGSDAEVLKWVRAHATQRVAEQIDQLLLASTGKYPVLQFDPYDWSVNS